MLRTKYDDLAEAADHLAEVARYLEECECFSAHTCKHMQGFQEALARTAQAIASLAAIPRAILLGRDADA